MKNMYAFIKGLSKRWKLTSLIVALTHSLTVAQTGSIDGRVTDENDQGMPGVSVMLKNSSTGSVTDIEGNYKVSAEQGDVLIFNFIGYKGQEVLVGGQTTVDVKMEVDLLELEELVVVGYGEVNRRDLTGSVASVGVDEMIKAPVPSFDQALAGRVAGVQVTSTQGRPGSNTDIKIRGTGSLTQSSAPLYVIDGFPIEDYDMSSIDPSDIESIEILKGPSAVAIYGSRGGNGVILISSKSGKEGKIEVSYDGFYGVEDITKRIDVLSPYDFVDLRYEVDSASAAGTYGPLSAYQNADGSSISGIDWQNETFNQTSVQNHVVSVRGGSEATKYNLSVSKYTSEGLLENSGFDRTYAKFRFDQKVTSKLDVGTNISYTSSKTTGTHTSANILSSDVDGGGAGSANFNLLKDIIQARPTGGLFTSNEDLLTWPDDPDDDSSVPLRNPLVNARTQIREDIKNTLLLNGYLNYEIIEGLDFRVGGGIQRLDRRKESFDELNSAYERRNGVTRGSIGVIERTNTLLSTTLTYKKNFSKRHEFTGLLGFDYQDIVEKMVEASGSNFPEPNKGVDNLGAATAPGLPVSTVLPTNRLISYFGRVNYSFDGKYLITGTLRADGSSRFGENEKFGIFPSVSGAWRFSDESFLDNVGVLADGKLRFEWGQVGNNRIPANVSSSILQTTSYGLENGTAAGVLPSNLANPDIRWEVQEQVNLGIDLGFFNNRLTVSADVYRKIAKDLLLEAPLPTSTGFTTVFRNVGEIRNDGIELLINTVNINSNGFKWTSSINMTFPQRETLGLVASDTLYSSSQWATSNVTQDSYANDFITQVGQPFGLIYGYLEDGLYQPSDFDEDGVPYVDHVFGGAEPGYRKYVDINGDSTVNELDRVVLGDPTPDFFGGFNNNFQFKSFDLNVFLQWSVGNEIYNANRILWTHNLQKNGNFLPEVMDRWRTDNTDEENSQATYRSANDVSEVLTDRYVEDGSYLRLKTISLGYSLPRKLLDKIGAQRVRVYITGQNLVTWTNYTGYDPEVSTRGNGLTSGVDFGAYPRSRTFIGGLSVTF